MAVYMGIVCWLVDSMPKLKSKSNLLFLERITDGLKFEFCNTGDDKSLVLWGQTKSIVGLV